jgi:hypothetical protein
MRLVLLLRSPSRAALTMLQGLTHRFLSRDQLSKALSVDTGSTPQSREVSRLSAIRAGAFNPTSPCLSGTHPNAGAHQGSLTGSVLDMSTNRG